MIILIMAGNKPGEDFVAQPSPENDLSISREIPGVITAIDSLAEEDDCPCKIEQIPVIIAEAIAQLVADQFSAGVDAAIRHQLHSHRPVAVPTPEACRRLLEDVAPVRSFIFARFAHTACWQKRISEMMIRGFTTGAELAQSEKVCHLAETLTYHPHIQC